MMTAVKRAVLAVLGMAMLVSPVLGAQPTGGQNEFVPVSSLPAAEQVPAAPLVIAAYAFVWVAVLFYLWTIWRRIGAVESDMQALRRRAPERSSPR